jgi:hypothetical protein
MPYNWELMSEDQITELLQTMADKLPPEAKSLVRHSSLNVRRTLAGLNGVPTEVLIELSSDSVSSVRRLATLKLLPQSLQEMSEEELIDHAIALTEQGINVDSHVYQYLALSNRWQIRARVAEDLTGIPERILDELANDKNFSVAYAAKNRERKHSIREQDKRKSSVLNELYLSLPDNLSSKDSNELALFLIDGENILCEHEDVIARILILDATQEVLRGVLMSSCLSSSALKIFKESDNPFVIELLKKRERPMLSISSFSREQRYRLCAAIATAIWDEETDSAYSNGFAILGINEPDGFDYQYGDDSELFHEVEVIAKKKLHLDLFFRAQYSPGDFHETSSESKPLHFVCSRIAEMDDASEQDLEQLIAELNAWGE